MPSPSSPLVLPPRAKYRIGERVLGSILGPLYNPMQFPENSPRLPHLELERVVEVCSIGPMYAYRLKSSGVLFFESQVKRI